MWKVFPLVTILLMASTACDNGNKRPKADKGFLTDVKLLHDNQQKMTEIIIYAVFNPPIASRIYAYTSLAAYEAIRFQEKEYPSLVAQLHGFSPIPQPEAGKKYNFLLAATRSFFTVADKLPTFYVDSLKPYLDGVYADFKSLLDEETYNRSILFGDSIAKIILDRASKDNYKKTRGMEKYLGSNDQGKWKPTPPDYNDGVEPFWSLIQPLALDSANHCKATPAPKFSKDTTSEFYKIVKEVYDIGKKLNEEERTIAKYWDDNPFVMEHSGHLMFGNKKITPVGHWMGITSIACKIKSIGPVQTAQAYALSAIAIFDSFIACFEEKYKSQLVRPVTVINEMIDRNWQPYLQTPAFPEHTSGHSTISAAAAAVLTKRFGDNFKFEDTSDLAYIGMKRSFNSFLEAANEASISRLYGGIHYRTGINAGARQGLLVADVINNKIRLKE